MRLLKTKQNIEKVNVGGVQGMERIWEFDIVCSFFCKC